MLECREFLFAFDEWKINGSDRGVQEMEAIIREFETRYQIHFEPEPLSIYGAFL